MNQPQDETAPDAAAALGEALDALRAQQPQVADPLLDSLLEHDAIAPLARVLRARSARISGDFDRADDLLGDARVALGEHPQLLAESGYVALARGNAAAAVRLFERLADAVPDLADVHFNLGLAYRARGRHAAARVSFERALELDGGAGSEIHAELGLLLLLMRRPDEATRHIDRALELDRSCPMALTASGALAAGRGDFDAARRGLRAAREADAGHAAAWLMLAAVTAFSSPDDAELQRIQSRLAEDDLPPALREALNFAAGKALDDCGQYDAAFAHYRQANRLARCRVAAYEPRRHEERVDALIEICDTAFMERLQAPSSGHRPIFVAGLPRSGATLLELSLARHSAVTLGGELPFFDKAVPMRVAPWPDTLARLGGAPAGKLASEYLDVLRAIDPEARVTNRHPANVLHLGLIAARLPDATLIHCERDLLDNCLSLYFAALPAASKPAFSFEHIAHYALQHRRLTAHWHQLLGDRLLRVRYEDFVIDPEAGVDALLRHADLPFEAECVTPRDADAVVLGPSAWQVRQPIHVASCERWRHYAAHLEPLADALGVTLD